MQVCSPQDICQAHSQNPPNSRVSLEKPLSLTWLRTICLISPWGQSWERVLHKHKCIQITARVPKAQVLWCMHECLCKTHSRDCPHGEVAFSNSNINKKQCTIKICQITSFMSTMGKWHLIILFTHSRQIYYGWMIHYDLIHNAIWNR